MNNIEKQTNKKGHNLQEAEDNLNGAHIWKQEQPAWVPFDDKVNDKGERHPPAQEDIERLNKTLTELGQVFSDSNVKWHLDGALNISLMKGDYIGDHKDVDISVEESDLEKLENQLMKNGYGLFLSKTIDQDGNKELRRVGYKNFADTDVEHMLIASMDENGKIVDDRNLNFLDVHIIKRNQDNKPVGILDVELPEEWMKPEQIKFNSETINISHPGKVLYYKIQQGRDYDKTDIERLIETGRVTEKDMDNIDRIFEDEFTASVENGKRIFGEISSKIKEDMTEDDIFDVITKQPDMAKKVEDTGSSDRFKGLAKQIFLLKGRTADAVFDMALDYFKYNDQINQKRGYLKEIRGKISDNKEIENIRNDLNNSK